MRSNQASEEVLRVTVDTNLLDPEVIAHLRLVATIDVEFATVTVNERERGGRPEASLTVIPETAVWGESRWDEAVWGGPIPELLILDETPLGTGALAGENDVDVLEAVLQIISNGSFPSAGERNELTAPTQRQLRDAMSYEAHVRARRHVFVTNDTKGFVNHGRRDALEGLGRTYIRTPAEFEALCRAETMASILQYVPNL